ncbi:hypothetical protein LEFCBN_LEFCBN_17065, partial [Dysosmobacter welbionis]
QQQGQGLGDPALPRQGAGGGQGLPVRLRRPQQKRQPRHVPLSHQPDCRLSGVGPEVGQVLPLRPGRQLHRVAQPPEGQPHRAVLIVLHAQKTAPQLVIRPQVQPLPAEGVVIGISGAEDVVIKVMGRAVLLIN